MLLLSQPSARLPSPVCSPNDPCRRLPASAPKTEARGAPQPPQQQRDGPDRSQGAKREPEGNPGNLAADRVRVAQDAVRAARSRRPDELVGARD
jgi:hypothetical protein